MRRILCHPDRGGGRHPHRLVGPAFSTSTRPGRRKAPTISTTHNGVVAKGGQSPAFDVETGSVEIGTKNTNVNVPNVTIKPPPGQARAVSGRAERRQPDVADSDVRLV